MVETKRVVKPHPPHRFSPHLIPNNNASAIGARPRFR